jgi:hypothetical protein
VDCHIKCPKYSTVGYSSTVLNICYRARNAAEDSVVFDFSGTEFITPFGIILLSGTMSECLASGKTTKYKAPVRDTTRKFLSAIGFNKFFRLTNGGHKIESPNVQLRRLGAVDYLLTDQILEVFGYSIKMTDGVKGSLKLALNELMINVFDHSESVTGCYVCAQSYPQAKNIRLCIADFGIGILGALKKNKAFASLRSARSAIKTAIQDGVTSRPSGDAGKGLPFIQRFMKVNEGKMYILSGNGKVLWDYSTPQKELPREETMHIPFEGTIVKLEINTNKQGLYYMQSEDGNIF